ncbi:Sov1p NDAI_0G04520 [Naumovozyma dairenensis CBS 421]|uniref:Uncharacterized protein n=1 Tax=Naumovozyma dairenensis (strain ATCC 10597 / BCRC 20456 / CBS 421 / NBRC 0211 / NRRL Y-12639) TaxID=1071378 RepID=J7RT98_NAUDC|nr:hypothetical protein NDAI_0G04520 [Naumovozyma dairenensis CBS 421]CCK73437.1 hypothetical protein NDAI_0G04520 [Naumovozyma dairenensis CBS 421]
MYLSSIPLRPSYLPFCYISSRFLPTVLLHRNIRYIHYSYRSKKLDTNIDTKLPHDLKPLQDPNEIIKTLKQTHGFSDINDASPIEETFLQYLTFLNKGFQKSDQNLRLLKENLKSTGNNNNEKFNLIFSYLLTESTLELQRFKQLGPEGLKSIKQQQQQQSNDEDENSVVKNEKDLELRIMNEIFSTLTEKNKENEVYLHNVDFLFKILTELNSTITEDKGFEHGLSIEQFVEAFEISKLIPIEGRKSRGIFLSGNLIYSTKKVRMDPINESLYIDSLLKYRLFKKAFQLYDSRKDKVNERWWNELGMMILLRSNHLASFKSLLQTTDEQFNVFPYLSPRVLKLAIRKYLAINDHSMLKQLIDRFLLIVDTYGIEKSNSYMESSALMKTFQEENEASAYLNEQESYTTLDFASIIESLLYNKRINFASKLSSRFVELPQVINNDDHLKEFLTVTKLNLLKDFHSLKTFIEPHMSNAKRNLGTLQEVFNDIIKGSRNESSPGNELLFDNINSLVSTPLLTNLAHEFIYNEIASTSTRNQDEDPMTNSKRFYGLIKVLLVSGKEKTALKVLRKMEEARQLMNKKEGNETANEFYPEVNAHHYAEFIAHYTILLKASKINNASKLKIYEHKVENILNKMSKENIGMNATFLSKLLIFYRTTFNLNKSFEIINQILDSKDIEQRLPDVSRTNFYQSRTITKKLYLEIWNCYYLYNKIFHDEIGRIKKTSNYVAWKNHSKKIKMETNIHPKFNSRWLLKTMLEQDNILPDDKFFHLIIATFIRERCWTVLPSVLILMNKRYNIKITTSLGQYINQGIKKEYILSETDKLNQHHQYIEGTTNIISTDDNKFKAKQTITKMVNNGEILKKVPIGESLELLVCELLKLLQFKNHNSSPLNEVLEVANELAVDNVIIQNIIDKIKH